MSRFFGLMMWLLSFCQMVPLWAANEENMVPELADGIRTVAVWDFDSATMPGQADAPPMDYLAKAIPEMIVEKLVSAADVKIVERVQLQETLAEQKLGAGDLTDPKTRIQLGRISGARFMVFGTYMILGPMIQVSVRVVNSETSLMTLVDNKDGDLTQLPKLLDDLARSVLRSFSKASLSTTAFGWNTDLDLWKRQEQGIKLLELRHYQEAAKVFDALLKDHPDFIPAKRQGIMARVGNEFQLALKHQQAGRHQAAIEIFKKILVEYPQFQPARNRLKEALLLKRHK